MALFNLCRPSLHLLLPHHPMVAPTTSSGHRAQVQQQQQMRNRDPSVARIIEPIHIRGSIASKIQIVNADSNNHLHQLQMIHPHQHLISHRVRPFPILIQHHRLHNILVNSLTLPVLLNSTVVSHLSATSATLSAIWLRHVRGVLFLLLHLVLSKSSPNFRLWKFGCPNQVSWSILLASSMIIPT